jgi:uncharacterized protein
MRPEDLASKSKKDLLELARKHDIAGRSAMSKEELTRAITKASAPSKGREAKGQPKAEAKGHEAEPKGRGAKAPAGRPATPPHARKEEPPVAAAPSEPEKLPRPENRAESRREPPPERPVNRPEESARKPERPEPRGPQPPQRPVPPSGRPLPPRYEGQRRGIPPVDPAMKLSRVEEIRKSTPGRDDRHGRRGPGPHEGASGRPPIRGGDRFPPPRRDHDERSLQAREHLRRSGEHRPGPYTPQFDRPRDRDRDRGRDRGGRDRRGIDAPRTAPIPERFANAVTPQPPSPPPQHPAPPALRGEPGRGGHPLELPATYGVDRLVIMVRDPYWIHAYWEITPASISRAREQLGDQWEGHRWILRMHSYPEGNGQASPSLFELDVNAEARNWYLRVPHPDWAYEGMIGILTRDGTFFPFARSNRVRTPRDTMSDATDVQWATTQEEYEKIYKASGGHTIGASSAEAREEVRRRHEETLFSGMLGSMGSGAMVQRPRGFWFQINTELILYGATEPDANVTVQGRQITLRPDGTFTLRFQLPDGIQEIPCVATSSDGISKKTITPVVRRHTTSEDAEVAPKSGEAR